MHDDLNKPLGLAKPAKPRRFAPALMLAAIVAAAGFGAAVLLLQRPAVEPAATVAASIENGQSQQLQEAAAEQAADPVKTGSARRLEIPAAKDGEDQAAGDGSAIQSLAPDGAIVAKLPSPKPARQEAGLAHMPDPQLIERVEAGAIPKRGADGRRPLDVYSRQPATEGNFGVARVVLIVGGVGISQSGSQDAVRKLPGAVNLAFAPYGNSLGRWMQEARRAGHELLLQVPMQPYDWPSNDPGPHTLLAEADAAANRANLHWAMSRITNYVGVVNFLGGKLLAEEQALVPLFNELASRGLAFVDDGSMANSRSAQAAATARLPYARADIQIDAVRTRREIAARLDELVQQARRTGLAIGMANAFPETIQMLAQFCANAEKLGIEITPVTAVLNDPEGGNEG